MDLKDLRETVDFANTNKSEKLNVQILVIHSGRYTVTFKLGSYVFGLSTQRRNRTYKTRSFKTLDVAYSVAKKIPNVGAVEIVRLSDIQRGTAKVLI